MIRTILNLKSGTAINRQYRNAKKAKYFSAGNILLACTLGYNHAKTHNNFVLVDITNILLFGRIVEISRKTMKNLKPEYKEIVERAKNIFANKK